MGFRGFSYTASIYFGDPQMGGMQLEKLYKCRSSQGIIFTNTAKSSVVIIRQRSGIGIH